MKQIHFIFQIDHWAVFEFLMPFTQERHMSGTALNQHSRGQVRSQHQQKNTFQKGKYMVRKIC